MIITLKKNTPQEEIQKMIEALESKNDVAVTLYQEKTTMYLVCRRYNKNR